MTDLENFADAVRTALARIPADSSMRFGRKVWIAALDLHKSVANGLLIEAHRAGLLTLSRADLTPAFDRDVMVRSEVTYLGIATFHFVEAA